MIVHIDGGKINGLDDFYNQLEPILKQMDCPWGRNLDSLEEIVQSAFNYSEDSDRDVSQIAWKNSSHSKVQLGKKATKLTGTKQNSTP